MVLLSFFLECRNPNSLRTQKIGRNNSKVGFRKNLVAFGESKLSDVLMIPEDASTKHAVEMYSQQDGKFDFVFQNRKMAENPTELTVNGLKYPQ